MEKSIKVIPQEKLNKPEEVIVKQACRIKPHGESVARLFKKGEKVTVSGIGKAELIYRDLAEYPAPKKPAPQTTGGK